MRRWFLAMLPVILFGGAIPRAEVSPEGTLEIFGQTAGNAVHFLVLAHVR